MDGVVNDRSCVDVVIPVFNGRDTIKAALTSVFEQGNFIHRIIVIDDGSCDDTAQVVQSLGDPLIELACFLKQIDISSPKRLSLHWALFIGSFQKNG